MKREPVTNHATIRQHDTAAPAISGTTRRFLALLAAAAICGADCGNTADPPLTASGVGVVAEGCPGPATESGSGVAVGPLGHIVTVAHTVAGAASIIVVDGDGVEFAASIVAFDKDADLALLDAPGLNAPALSIGPLAPGDATALVWSRESGVSAEPASIIKRLAITIEDIYLENEVERAGLELSADIDSGDSGGAVVDAEGRVVGIIYAKSVARADTAFATSDVEIRRLLDERPLDAIDRCT